ncbi:MAG: HEPN domain-containing protein [bacterium]
MMKVTPFMHKYAFTFQQSVEKYLKAYIVAHELPFKKIHELSELLRICQEHDDSFSEFKEECDFLTDFYIDTRYPVHWPTYYTQEEARKSQESANRIGCFVKTCI